MNKLQMKKAQASNAVINTLEVFGIESNEFIKAARNYIKRKKRYTTGSCLKVYNDRLELHQGYVYCDKPDTVEDCRVNSLYTRP